MPVIDADTHVDETEETWEYMDPAHSIYKPISVMPDLPSTASQVRIGYNRYWFIDGRLRVRRIRDDHRTGTTQAMRELLDVEARLARMDEFGADIQVLYPTVLLSTVTAIPAAETALYRSYNRWLADKCSRAKGRLRWVALLPLLSMEKALDELRFAKDHGACGILKKAVDCGDRPITDPYFFPLYEEASRLDMPICIHSGGGGNPNQTDASMAPVSVVGLGVTPLLEAFHALITHEIPRQFPSLRFGFIEASASWIPFLIHALAARAERMAWLHTFDFKKDLLRENRFYVTCQTDDDLPYILQYAGEDNLVIGSDFSHADSAAEVDALHILKGKGEKGEISAVAARKILDGNARALYSL